MFIINYLSIVFIFIKLCPYYKFRLAVQVNTCRIIKRSLAIFSTSLIEFK